MQSISTIGLDIAKSAFQVHGVDAAGQVVIRRQLRRRHVLAFFQKLPPCLVGIEACALSHHWSRELQALGHTVRLGKFRALAVSTTTRFPELPDIPTVQELGISNFDVTAWFGLVAPAATPDSVVQRLNAATGEMLAAPAARDRLLALGAVPKSSSPKELADLIAADISRWSEVVDKAGIERI